MMTGKGPVPPGRVTQPCSMRPLLGNVNSAADCPPATGGAGCATMTPSRSAFAATAVWPSPGDEAASSTGSNDDEDAAAPDGCIQRPPPDNVAATAAVNRSF